MRLMGVGCTNYSVGSMTAASGTGRSEISLSGQAGAFGDQVLAIFGVIIFWTVYSVHLLPTSGGPLLDEEIAADAASVRRMRTTQQQVSACNFQWTKVVLMQG